MNLHDTLGMKYVNWQPSNTCNTSLYQLINSTQTCILNYIKHGYKVLYGLGKCKHHYVGECGRKAFSGGVL